MTNNSHSIFNKEIVIKGRKPYASQRPFAVPPLVSTVKLRQAGFGACIDTEDCIVQHLQAMQLQGYLP